MSDSRGVVRPGIYKEIVYRDVAFLYRSFDNVIPVQLMYINMIFSFPEYIFIMSYSLRALKEAINSLKGYRMNSISKHHERYSFPFLSGTYFSYRKVDVQ